MRTTRTTTIATIAVAAFTFAACGSDEVSGVQAELTDAVLESIAEFNVDGEVIVDEGCVRDVIAALSDEEAAAGLEDIENPDSDSNAFDEAGEKIEDDCFSEA